MVSCYTLYLKQSILFSSYKSTEAEYCIMCIFM